MENSIIIATQSARVAFGLGCLKAKTHYRFLYTQYCAVCQKQKNHHAHQSYINVALSGPKKKRSYINFLFFFASERKCQNGETVTMTIFDDT